VWLCWPTVPLPQLSDKPITIDPTNLLMNHPSSLVLGFRPSTYRWFRGPDLRAECSVQARNVAVFLRESPETSIGCPLSNSAVPETVTSRSERLDAGTKRYIQLRKSGVNDKSGT
jgi:hypothetical protein